MGTEVSHNTTYFTNYGARATLSPYHLLQDYLLLNATLYPFRTSINFISHSRIFPSIWTQITKYIYMVAMLAFALYSNLPLQIINVYNSVMSYGKHTCRWLESNVGPRVESTLLTKHLMRGNRQPGP